MRLNFGGKRGINLYVNEGNVMFIRVVEFLK